jgi:hypothetical protein
MLKMHESSRLSVNESREMQVGVIVRMMQLHNGTTIKGARMNQKKMTRGRATLYGQGVIQG